MHEFSWLHPRVVPLIVAHRGSSALAPENTLAAFRQALQDGADAIELDVRLTCDNEVVVIHDAQLHRTTNGRGRVEDHSLAELKRLNAGRWFHPSYDKERISTLADVFELVRGRIGMNIELKSDRKPKHHYDLVDRCVQIIRQYRAQSYVLISSFHHHFIKHFKKQHPDIPGGLLVRPFTLEKLKTVSLAMSLHVEYIIYSGTSLRKSTVTRAHDRHLFVGEYTVNTRRRALRSLRYKVDAIITDDPSRTRNILEIKTPPLRGH